MKKVEKIGKLEEFIKQLHKLEEKKVMNEFQEVFTAFVKSQEKALLKIVEQMKKDLVLPRPYKGRTHYHRDKEIATTSYLDENIEGYKAKLKKWLGEK